MLALSVKEGVFSPSKSQQAFLLKVISLASLCVIRCLRVLSECGELLLFLLTWPGPWVILALIVTAQAFLAVKPIAHHLLLLGEQSYERCFLLGKRQVARFFSFVARVYHKHEIVGLENIPLKGGAVLAYYHGPIPLDYIFLSSELILRRNRFTRSVVDKVMVWMPFFYMMRSFGCFAGTREDVVSMLKSGCLVGVAPGGGWEAQCGDASTYELLWKRREGFAAAAFEAQVPVIPFFTSNIRECVVSMQSGLAFWRALYAKTKVPAVPLYGYFPVKMTTHIGRPIWPSDFDSPTQLRNAVVDAMNELIAKNQTLPGSPLKAMEERVESETAVIQDWIKRKLHFEDDPLTCGGEEQEESDGDVYEYGSTGDEEVEEILDGAAATVAVSKDVKLDEDEGFGSVGPDTPHPLAREEISFARAE